MSLKDGKIVIDLNSLKKKAILAIPFVLFLATWGLWAEKEEYKNKLFLARHPPSPALIVANAPSQECLRQRYTKYGTYCAGYASPPGWSTERFERHCSAIWRDVVVASLMIA